MNERSPQEVAQALSSMDVLICAIADNAAHIAHARRALFDAYRAEGFSDEAALILCQKLFLT